MSDFEDDMDIDGLINHSIIFNSDNTNAKGKRSAANLPVEAEDSLPWWFQPYCTHSRGNDADYSRVEKYRPNSLEDVSGHQDILATLNKFVNTNVGYPERNIDLPLTHMCTATTSSPFIRATRDRQDVHYFSTCQADIR